MTLTTLILSVLALFLLQIFLQEVSLYRFSIRAILGNRDDRPEPSLLAARLGRAKNNLFESLPFFIALALLAFVKQGENGAATAGATVFLVARILYVPAYATGVFGLRSATWLAAIGGLLMMAWSIVTVA